MSTLLEPLLQSPRLPELVNELQARLAEERARRQKFYEELIENTKAEFINGEVIVHSPAKVRPLKGRDNLQDLLRAFVKARQLGWVTGEKALCAFPRNDYEPANLGLL